MIPATELLPDLERRRLRALVGADMVPGHRDHAGRVRSGRETVVIVTPSAFGVHEV